MFIVVNGGSAGSMLTIRKPFRALTDWGLSSLWGIFNVKCLDCCCGEKNALEALMFIWACFTVNLVFLSPI